MKYWSKSALSIYKYLETMSMGIDKAVKDIVSGSNSALLQKSQSTYCQASRIIELMDRKRKIINLKVAIEEGVNRLDKINKKIIALVFFDGLKSEKVSQMLDVSIRTFFRKKTNAMNNFSIILKGIGFDEEFFISEYMSEKWFMSVYNDIIVKTAEADYKIDSHLAKRIIREVPKIVIKNNNYGN